MLLSSFFLERGSNMIENIVTGRVFRVLSDASQNIWDRISFWKKASDVEYDDGTNLEDNKPLYMIKRSTSYSLGSVGYIDSAPSWVMFKCTTAGTTAATEPSTYQTIASAGTVITDGSAKFTVYDIRFATNFSANDYMPPAVSLLDSIDSQLIANGNHFYFDYQNGQYGCNISSSRPASSFISFS